MRSGFSRWILLAIALLGAAASVVFGLSLLAGRQTTAGAARDLRAWTRLMDAQAKVSFTCEVHSGGGLYPVSSADGVREAGCLLRRGAISRVQFASIERELRASPRPDANWWPVRWQVAPDGTSVAAWSVLTALVFVLAAWLVRSFARVPAPPRSR